jgi:hypothetical protein
LDGLCEYLYENGYNSNGQDGYEKEEIWRAKKKRLVAYHAVEVDPELEREENIRSFFSTPHKRIYIDAHNVAQTVEKVREFRRIIPAVDEVSLEFPDDSLGICHAYAPCMEMDDDYFLLRLLCETDGLFISKDRFAYLSDELLITAGLCGLKRAGLIMSME